MILTVAFYTFVAFTVIQLCYFFYFSSFLFKSKKKRKTKTQEPVSIIVFVKNSEVFLSRFLPSIIEQQYSKFEIVLINNASIDDTAEIIETFKEKNQNIKIIDVENNEAFWGNKKYALTLGIKAAKYENLLFTDPDCIPNSKFWIQEMASNFTNKKTIILGYSKLKVNNTITNLIARFHNLTLALQCFSFAKSGAPFMAFGNNYGYTKSTFFKVKGYINHIKVKNGENDLFIRDAATKENISFCVSEKSLIEKDTLLKFTNWFQSLREKRQLKKHYNFKHRFFISFFIFSKAVFYVLAILLFFYYPWTIILPIVLSYFLTQFIVFGFSAKKLKESYLIFFLPFLDISLLLIQISIFSANLISKPNN